MDKILVIFDSTVIVANYHLLGPNFTALLGAINEGGVELAVPAIVIEEAVNKFKEKLLKNLKNGQDALKEISFLIRHEQPFPINSDELKSMVDHYKTGLSDRLSKLNASILPYDEIPHSAIVTRSLDRRKPFSGGGKGYRDALLWESILRGVGGNYKKIILISGNTSDFGKKEERPKGPHYDFHEDYQEDITNNFDPCPVFLCKDIESFNQKYTFPNLSQAVQIRLDLEKGALEGLILEDWLGDKLDDIAFSLQNSEESLVDSLGFNPGDISNLFFIHNQLVSSIEIDNVYELTDNLIIIECGFVCQFLARCDLSKTAFLKLSQIISITMSVEEWHDENALVNMFINLPVHIIIEYNTALKDPTGYSASYGASYGWCPTCGLPVITTTSDHCIFCRGKLFKFRGRYLNFTEEDNPSLSEKKH